MPLMRITLKNKANQRNSRLKPGSYKSQVIACENAPGYKEGDAVLIRYELTDSNGHQYPYEETFWTPEHPPQRTKDFYAYLDKYDIGDSWDDLVGYLETVTLAYAVKDSGRHLDIVDRCFVSEDSEEEGDNNINGE